MPRKSAPKASRPRRAADVAPVIAMLEADLAVAVSDELVHDPGGVQDAGDVLDPHDVQAFRGAEQSSSAVLLDPAQAKAAIDADFQLARRCVAGEVMAWEQLHGDCHNNLLATARRLLRGRSNDPNLAEEIVAQVWYALVANDGELLLRFDPQRGARLMTFLRAIVRDLLSRHFRSEIRRMGRECESALDKPQHHSAALDHAEVSLDEFLDTLAPGERLFYDEYLLDSPDDEPASGGLTRTNVWQKTHRIYNKFRRFFGHDD